MIITCEQCNTSFNLDESLLKPSGSKVKCSKCDNIFTAYPPSPPEEIEEAEQPVEAVPDVDAGMEPQEAEPVAEAEAPTAVEEEAPVGGRAVQCALV